jgi:hypothetical protein
VYLFYNSSKLGYDLLLLFENLGKQFEEFSKLFLQSSNFEFKFRPNHPSLANLLPLSLISLANRPRGGKDLLEISLCVQRSSKISFLFVQCAWHRREKGSLRPPIRTPPSPSALRPDATLDPQQMIATPADHPCTTLPRSLIPSAPHAAPGHCRSHREHMIGAERHRPFPDPSPRHWPRADPHDQFPEAEDHDPDRTRHPDPARSTPSCPPARPERLRRSRASAHPLALHLTHACMARWCCHDATPAQPSGAPQPPRQALFSPSRV